MKEIGIAAGSLVCYPNPANGMVQVTYETRLAGKPEVSLFDLSGKAINTIPQGMQPAGKHEARIDVRNLANGLYLIRVSTADHAESIRVMITHE
jgi:hypothetical protein